MSTSAASSNLGSSEAKDEVKLSGLAEPPENSEAVRLSQGRDNTHWANVYYLQNKYSFPLAAWASWTWRPPIWLADWPASSGSPVFCVTIPLARLPSSSVWHQVWLSTVLGSQLKPSCFHNKQLTNRRLSNPYYILYTSTAFSLSSFDFFS